jgi:hypothetical protein
MPGWGARAWYSTVIAMGVVAGLTVAQESTAIQSARAVSCSPRILDSPRRGSTEVQAEALNDRGDIVGFADGPDGADHAVIWPQGAAQGAIDLGVLPGYVSSEAYGINDDGVVFGLLYDRKERQFPFRWADGRMTVLRSPSGRRLQALTPDRNAINDRGQIVGTLIAGGDQRAVRWSPDGKAKFLPRLPGHAWALAWSINAKGVVSGWSRKRASEDGENNPVLWTRSGKVVALRTKRARADGAAEQTNRSGLTVGYLGNFFSDGRPESDQAAVWRRRSAKPRLMGPTRPLSYGELVDVNDQEQAAGMIGRFTRSGFPLVKPAVWKAGWPRLRKIPVPAASRNANRVVTTQLHDINAQGAIVGDVFGLTRPDYGALRRIDPVLWTCSLGD